LDPCDRDVLGPNEQAALARLPAACQRRRFLELWTLKEAYVKARGTGFALRPECVEFGFPRAHTLVFRPQSLLDDQADRWHFWQFRLAPDLLVALCVERLGCRPEIVLQGSAPLAVEGEHADSWCLRSCAERRHGSFPIGRVRARPDLLS
jgi:4'-phosphopantetheinyl transferase